MLKRFMPLLFVVLVVVATVFLFLALRDRGLPPTAGVDSAPQPALAERALLERIGADGIREFRVESEQEYQLALEALGTSNDEIEAWARSVGFPPATYTSFPGLPLERNYRRESEGRLRELADAGDLWATQFLAQRISPGQPEEAIELYREAVILGSAYAAFRLGNLYHEVARWVILMGDDRTELEEMLLREDPIAYTALGWLMLAEYEAGLPPGALSATLAGFQAPEESIDRSCERAAGFLAEVRAEREARGIVIPARRPPLAIELPSEETEGYCAPELFPRADFSGCETIRLSGDVGSVIGHRCR